MVIAADAVDWDYAPLGKDPTNGQSLDTTPWLVHGPDRIGRVFEKALYRGYTDATFTKLAPRPADEQHLGIMGPLIRAVVGDSVVVVFKNNLKLPVSMHLHGLEYDPANEGIAGVAPGTTFTYRWAVRETAGPGSTEGTSVAWMYHSHVNEPRDTNAGLVGPIVVTAAKAARQDGHAIDVDREMFALYTVFDENESSLLDDNMRKAGDPASIKKDDPEFMESNLKHTVNGRMFANDEPMVMKQGERVRWYVFSMGTEVDLHTPHWHGNTVEIGGMRTDVASVLPMEMVTADMDAMNAGSWLFHCHVDDHLEAGMIAFYTVLPGDGSSVSGPHGSAHDDT